MKKVMLLMAVMLSGTAMADEKRPEPRPEMKAAFEACQATAKPRSDAFDACMSSKGFKKPEHGEKRAHEMPKGLKEAMEACKTKGKPGNASFEACMTEKGFTKPE